jgi:hypothetical protein
LGDEAVQHLIHLPFPRRAGGTGRKKELAVAGVDHRVRLRPLGIVALGQIDKDILVIQGKMAGAGMTHLYPDVLPGTFSVLNDRGDSEEDIR